MSATMPLPDDIAAQLQAVRAELDTLQQQRARLLVRRDTLVASARQAGGTLREIGELVGLSHQAIADIEERFGEP